jgi:hypothetical protein
MAVLDILGAWHGATFNNMVFYYNPVTSRLEPVPDDAFTENCYDPGDMLFRLNDRSNKGKFLKDLFSDLIFTEIYLKELERVSQKFYMDDILDDLNKEIERNSSILHREMPYYKFPADQLYKNQRLIREILNPCKGVQAYLGKRSPAGIALQLGNNKTIPMEILYMIYKKDVILRPVEKRVILQGKDCGAPVRYEKIEFNLPDGFVWSDDMISESMVIYRLLGTSKLRKAFIFSHPAFDRDFFEGVFIAKPSHISDFPFLNVDPDKKEIRIKQGKWDLNRDLLIPEGYTFFCGAGTELNLTDSAKILSYSPLIFIGLEEFPIKISSTDSKGQGIAVLNSPEKSIFKNVIFENLSALSQNGWELTGAVNFYESPVYFYQCRFFQNIRGDDFLNIIRCGFTIDKSLFSGTFADALDIDFSEGKIADSFFVNCGNGDMEGDGIDISGSSVEMENIFIDGIGDKGLSVGENSTVSAKQVKILNANIAVASKDMSEVSIEDIVITDSESGFVVFQKKPEFGPAKISVDSFAGNNIGTPHLIEEGSILVIDGRGLNGKEKDVAAALYKDN